MSVEVKLIGDANNSQVVHVAGRRFPGVVVQGDSLSNLVDLASEIIRLLKSNEIDEAKDTAEELHGLLSARLQIYNDTITKLD
ncbi:DUF6959 family protein [Lacipirellula sp.]|uniref:DUF6959 family protein n=1 Tax=Lacipirellula sp. TaxID=2691419 RepID=UPI003D10CFF8